MVVMMEKLKTSSLLVTEGILAILKTRRVSTTLKIGHALNFAEDMEIEPYSGIFRGFVLPRRSGAFSYSNSPVHRMATMGRYCSIAAGVRIMGNSHPHAWISISPFSYGSWRSHANIAAAVEDANQTSSWTDLHFRASKGAPIIGNDVWIGQDVLLSQGISIADGAVIAAGSIVTKDVEPYTIVGGTPAKLLRRRFPEDLTDRLMKSQWWNYRFTDFAGMPFDKPAAFLDQLGDKIASGNIQPYRPTPLTAHDLHAAS